MSRLRVAERVAHGGHDIPLEDIECRFPRSLRNLLTEFSCMADYTQCVMSETEVPELVFIQQGKERTIVNQAIFAKLEQEAGL